MLHNVALPPSDSPKKRSRLFHRATAARGLDKSLSHIYHGHGDMSRLDRARSPWKRRLLVGGITFLALSSAIAWGAFFVYRPDRGSFTGEGVSVSIEGPEAIESGAKTTYTTTVRNDGSVALGSAGLHLRLPEQFQVTADSANENDITDSGDINIGAIPPHESRTYTVSGYFLAELDKTVDLQTVLTYHPTDFNSEFQAVSTKPVHINGSMLDIAITAPKKTVAGEPVAIEVVVKNSSEQEMANLVVHAEYPVQFTPEKSTPAASNSSQSSWKITSLGAGKETKIRLAGSFTSAAKGAFTIPFLVSLDTPSTLLLQEKSEASVEVTEGDLLVAMVLNGRTEPQTVGFGDVLRYSISYRNIDDAVLEDASVSLSFEMTPNGAQILSWNELKDDKRGIQKGNTLTWTKKQIVSLGKIGPKEEGVVEVSIPVVSAPQNAASNGEDYSISASAEVAVNVINGQRVKRTAKTQPVIAMVHSDTHLYAEARYYNEEGQAIGSGPLPPQQGKTTTYHAELSITNSLHELGDLALTATLPDGAVIVGTPSAEAGVVTHDAKSKTLRWTLNWMPLTVRNLTIGFDIAFTPTKAMVGKIPPILDNIAFTAKDKTLGDVSKGGTPFSLGLPALTTALEEDEKGSGKGKVE